MTAMSKTETWIYVVNRSKYVFYASLHIILLFHENKQGVRMTGREGNISHDCPAFKVEASRFKRTILSCSSAKLPFDLSANVYSGTWNNKQTLVSNGSLLRASCCSREFHFNSFVWLLLHVKRGFIWLHEFPTCSWLVRNPRRVHARRNTPASLRFLYSSKGR